MDVAPLDDGADPVHDARVIVAELAKFSPDLAVQARWLALNKLDLVPEDERQQRCEDIVQRLEWTGPVFRISALASEGTQLLVYKIMDYLEQQAKPDGDAAKT